MNPMPRNLFILVVIVVVVAFGYLMTRPDQRTTTQKVGDAIHELPQGVNKATDELKDDRTPGQKLGDDMRDAGDKIKENSSSH